MNKESAFKDTFLQTKTGCFVIYTCIWLAAALFILFIFKSQGRSVLWNEDGIYQHFISFNYSCDVVDSIFHGQTSASADLYNYTIGQGADIITTLNSYDFTNPVQWICAFLLPFGRLTRYTIMLFVNLYLIGAAFIIYCFSTDRRQVWAVVAGTCAYTFSGVILCMFMRHPNYINWAYFLPLMLTGYELFRRRHKALPLILIVAANAIVSFYTFYMDMILLIIYIVIKCVCNEGENLSNAGNAFGKRTVDNALPNTIDNNFAHSSMTQIAWGQHFKTELFIAFKAAGLCVVGILLSAVFFLPTIHAFLNNARVAGASGYTASAIHYPIIYYTRVLSNIFQPHGESGYNTILGLASIILITTIAAFALRKKLTSLKVWLIISILMLMVPLAGRIMNGFGYAVNRWSYAFSFICAVILVEMLPKLHDLSRLARWLIAGVSTVYIIIMFVLSSEASGRSIKITAVVLAATCLLTLLILHIRSDILRNGLLFALVLLTVGYQLWSTYSPLMEDHTSEFIKAAEEGSLFEDSAVSLSGKSTEKDFFRTESRERNLNMNGILNVKGTDIWWSMLPSYMLDYLLDVEINDISYNCIFRGLDTRAQLMELAAVKYYTDTVNGSKIVPIGYERNDELSDDQYIVYENKYALPVAYTLTQYITTEEYDSLSALEKQQVLMQAAVLDTVPEEITAGTVSDSEPASDDMRTLSGISRFDREVSVTSLVLKLIESDGIELSDGYINAKKDGTITFSTYVPDGYEVYFHFDNIEIINPDSAAVYVTRTSKSDDFAVRKISRITNMENEWPVIRDGITYNLGTGGTGENEITIRFANSAEYGYDSMELLAIPVDEYEKQAAALGGYTLGNSIVTGSSITGDIEVPDTRLLQFAVPYSAGWSAKVDGEKTPLYQSDGMYMALLLQPGTHHIELKYRTPYMLPGAIISFVTLAGIVIVEIFAKRRFRKGTE